MTWTNKVIWTEGMFLQPQHFQQHDRYTLSQELQRSNAQQPYGWGYLSLSLDSAAEGRDSRARRQAAQGGASRLGHCRRGRLGDLLIFWR